MKSLNSKYTWTEGDLQVTRSICWSPPGCHGGCGILLYHRDNRVIKVEGDKKHPFNRGQLCVRGLNVVEALYHPQRLTKPLVRDGLRGENKWRETGFDEAIDLIADKLLSIKGRYGPESVIFCKGTARDIGPYLERLCYGFGSPNYFGLGPGNGNACYRPRVAASTAIMGGLPIPDLGQFDPGEKDPPVCILIWGANPIHSNPDGLHGGWVVDAMKKGSKLIVVDPQRTWLASKAEHWLQIKPGTDGALALSFIHELFRSDLIDKAFCNRWVLGLDEIQQAAEAIPPEKAAVLTGIPAGDIVSAARFFAESRPASLFWGVAVDMNPGCLDTIQSLLALVALTGNVEIPGGVVLAGDPFGVERRGGEYSEFPQAKADRIGAEQYPLIEIGTPYAQPDVLLDQMESVKPYPIKAAWTQGASITPSSFADPERVLKLFKSLDFNVTVDIFMTPAAVAFADVILPVAMYPEKDSIFVHISQLGAVNKVIDPPGECKSDAEIALNLGKKIAPDSFPWSTLRDWLDERLKPAGLSFVQLREVGTMVPSIEYHRHKTGKLRKNGQAGFETPSGRIELRSSIFEKCGLSPIPKYTDYLHDYQERYNAERYPYILTTGARKPYYFCSEGRNMPSLRSLQPEALVQIHPQTALETDISSGDQVRISGPFGQCIMTADINDRFSPGIIHCDYGWWFPEEEGAEPHLYGIRRANINALFPSNLQGPGGFGYPFRGFICNIERVKD